MRSHAQCWGGSAADEEEKGTEQEPPAADAAEGVEQGTEQEPPAADEPEGVEIRGAFALCAFSWLVLPMLPATNFLFTVGTLVAVSTQAIRV